MSLSSWLSWTFSRSQARCSKRRSSVSRPKTVRLVLEQLEDRALPSSYSAANVSALITDINAANAAGGANTITLAAPTTSPYVLTGQLSIAPNDNLAILGNVPFSATGTPSSGARLRARQLSACFGWRAGPR
jgi:hypothetical protein